MYYLSTKASRIRQREAQQARDKHLNRARKILFVIGFLFIGINLLQVVRLRESIDAN